MAGSEPSSTGKRDRARVFDPEFEEFMIPSVKRRALEYLQQAPDGSRKNQRRALKQATAELDAELRSQADEARRQADEARRREAEKDKELAEKDKELAEKDKELAESRRREAESRRREAVFQTELDKTLALLRSYLAASTTSYVKAFELLHANFEMEEEQEWKSVVGFCEGMEDGIAGAWRQLCGAAPHLGTEAIRRGQEVQDTHPRVERVLLAARSASVTQEEHAAPIATALASPDSESVREALLHRFGAELAIVHHAYLDPGFPDHALTQLQDAENATGRAILGGGETKAPDVGIEHAKYQGTVYCARRVSMEMGNTVTRDRPSIAMFCTNLQQILFVRVTIVRADVKSLSISLSKVYPLIDLEADLNPATIPEGFAALAHLLHTSPDRIPLGRAPLSTIDLGGPHSAIRPVRRLGIGGAHDVYQVRLVLESGEDLHCAVKVSRSIHGDAALPDSAALTALRGIRGVPELVSWDGKPDSILALRPIGMPIPAYMAKLRSQTDAIKFANFVGQRLLEIVTQAHGREWVHLDIRPSNVVVQLDGENEIADVILVDWGSACRIGTRTVPAAVARFSHPELLNPFPTFQEAIVLPRHDVYSIACTMASIATMNPRFPPVKDGILADHLDDSIIVKFGPDFRAFVESTMQDGVTQWDRIGEIEVRNGDAHGEEKQGEIDEQ